LPKFPLGKQSLIDAIKYAREHKEFIVEGLWARIEVPRLGETAVNGVEAIYQGW
jgi:hypothetical protein